MFERINFELLLQAREAAGREASPSAGVIDSQSIKTTESCVPRGYDAAKKSQAPCCDRHVGPAGGCRGPSRRHAGSRRGRDCNPSHPRPVSLAAPSVCRASITAPTCASPCQIWRLDNRDRHARHRGYWLSPRAAPMGCRANPRLAQSKPPTGKGLRDLNHPAPQPGSSNQEIGGRIVQPMRL